MTFRGRVKLSEIAPNHPFAHDQISFVPTMRERPTLPLGRHGVTVAVTWGYERHEVKIGAARWRRIRRGEPVVARSIGWYEGKSFPCRWHFNLSPEDSLVVCYGDNGGEGFVGQIHQADIAERQL